MGSSRKVLLLVVEDDVLVRMTVVAALEEQEDFSVIEAATGEEALGLMDRGARPAVVITDINLGPGIDGLMLGQRLHDACPGLPIIYVTGRHEVLANRARSPCEAHLLKPFNLGTLAGLARGFAGRPEAAR